MGMPRLVVTVLTTLLVVSSGGSSHADTPTPPQTAQYFWDPPAQYRLGVWTTPIQFYETAINQYVAGLYVQNVKFNGPAHKKGIEGRDIIVRVDGIRVSNFQEFKEALNASGGLATIRLRNWRTDTYVDIPAVALEPTMDLNQTTPDQIP